MGVLTNTSPATRNKRNLTEVCLKIEMDKVSDVPRALQINFPDGACLIEVEVFSNSMVPLRAFLAFSPYRVLAKEAAAVIRILRGLLQHRCDWGVRCSFEPRVTL